MAFPPGVAFIFTNPSGTGCAADASSSESVYSCPGTRPLAATCTWSIRPRGITVTEARPGLRRTLRAQTVFL